MDWSDRIGRRLKPRDLHVFMAVAERGNMAKAADTLAISRPVVSKTIAELEHTLGVPLFDRLPQGVELTAYGRALLRRSVAVFDELRQSVEEIEFLSDASVGELRVGCPESLAAGFVSAIIDHLAVQHPKVVFRTELGTIHDLQFHSLRDRKCELVIGRVLSSTVDAPDIASEMLFHERLFVVVGRESEWARRRKISLAQLLEIPWILTPGEIEPEAPMAEAFRAIGIEGPRTTVWSSSLNLRNSLLATGRYVTVMPESVLRFGPQGTWFKVLPIDLPRWRLPIAVMTLKNRALNPVAELFIERARELAKPLAK
jgi:DNA-binding transcriptional LysR family regulator